MMTTTANRTASKKPPKHDLTHGPVAAAFNASVWPLCITAIGKWTGAVPPWTPLVGCLILAACLIAAGANRTPRPLSRISLIYRGVTAMAAGVWMWWQLATFSPVDLGAGQVTTLLVAWPATFALTVAALGASRLPALLRLLMPAVPAVLAGVVTVMHLTAVGTWLRYALTVTDRAHGMSMLTWFGYALLALVIMSAPTAVLGVTFATRERTADEELAKAHRDATPRTKAGQARDFQRLICKMTSEVTEWRPSDPTLPGRKVYNLTIADVQFWGNGAGETYIVDLTKNERGTTRTMLRSYTEQLATKLNLPPGCGIEILPAKDDQGEIMGAGYAAVSISRVNMLKESVPYPELCQRSILNALPLGVTRSGREIGPFFRESSAFLWGQKGSGKTGTIFDIIAGAMQCTDCLVWVIDLNRGNAAKPFLKPFFDGKVNRPCIDWVATTIEEIAIMAEVGLEIALERKRFYAGLKFEMDTNLMPVGNGAPGQPPPEILIVIDEGATVLGLNSGNQSTDEGRDARINLSKIMDLARDAAVNIVFSGLRATADIADTAFLRGTSIRIGMRVTDDAELAHGFGDWKLSGKQIPYQGSGYIRCGYADSGDDAGDDIQVFKAYFLAPKRMAAVGETVTPWRPYLDERSIVVGNSIAGKRNAYADRWRRTARELVDNPLPGVVNYGTMPGKLDGNTIDGEAYETAPATAAAGTAGTPVAPSSASSVAADGTSTPVGGSFDDMMQHARKLHEASKNRDGGGEGAQPPTAYTPPAPGQARTDAPLSDDQIKRKFADLTENMTVLSGDPDPDWNRSGKISPADEIAAAPGDSRAIIERLVKLAGPVGAGDLHTMLVKGGDWGPAVPISKVAMHKLLKAPGSKTEPAEWLAPRTHGDPYTHRDNVSG